MDDIEHMLIERECSRLVTAYCHLIDHGEAARVVDLFSEDATWATQGVKMAGREQLRAGFEHRQDQTERMSRHVCHNFHCNVIDENHAEGVVYLTLYRNDGDPDRKISPLVGPAVVGEYRDRFERTADGWRISHRELGVSFVASKA